MVEYKVVRTYKDDRGVSEMENMLNAGFEPYAVQNMGEYIEYIVRKIIPDEIQVDEIKQAKKGKN